MFGIRRRWPVLTGAAAALLYVVNNYQLTGLEHLHIQPVQSTRQEADAQLPQADAPSNPFGFDLTQFGINTAPPLNDGFRGAPYAPQVGTSAPAWNQLLSMGEKLALWQAGQSSNSSTTAPANSARPAFPATSPIPPPPGFVSPLSSLPGTSATQFSAGALGVPATADAIPTGLMTGLESPQIEAGALPPAAPATNRAQTIRVASFKLPALGADLLNKPQVAQLLVSILTQYDVVALQGIQSNRDDILPLVVEKLNQSGRSFDYLIGPRVGRGAPFQQFAFVFDTTRLETDRYQLYSVDDPEDLMTHEPLVAWFRCTGIPAGEAFTFTLINTAINPMIADAERAVLPKLVEAVQRDGRQEDDWILLGDFAGGSAQLAMLEGNGVRLAIRDVPTDVVGSQMLDSIIFSARATTEFTGRAGVFDFLRKYNLSLEQALEVSEHMPVWSEFTCWEGAQPGRIAPAPAFP